MVALVPASSAPECARQRALGKRDAFAFQSIPIVLNLTFGRLLRMARLCRDLRHLHQIAQESEGFAQRIIPLGADGSAVPGS